MVVCDRSDYQRGKRFNERHGVGPPERGGEQGLLTLFYSFVTASLGKFPGSEALESVPLSPIPKEAAPKEPRDPRSRTGGAADQHTDVID